MQFKIDSYLSKTLFIIISILLIIPGISYLFIYQNPDVRFLTSEWIYENIPNNALILSETANVVDIPIVDTKQTHKNFRIVSFNFYDLDKDPNLQLQLNEYLTKAYYIFIPSRRIFMNHQNNDYPLLNSYYRKLFSGELGFKEIAKFTSYPKISLFGKTIREYPDEAAEETWTVFDHPVIRIYQRSTTN